MLRDDGQLWAPGCLEHGPWGDRRIHGDPLPYAEGRVGESTQFPDRACLICAAAFTAGDRCYRPKRPPQGLAMAGWSAFAMTTALVCVECAERAIARGVPRDAPEPDRRLHIVTADEVLDG